MQHQTKRILRRVPLCEQFRLRINCEEHTTNNIGLLPSDLRGAHDECFANSTALYRQVHSKPPEQEAADGGVLHALRSDMSQQRRFDAHRDRRQCEVRDDIVLAGGAYVHLAETQRLLGRGSLVQELVDVIVATREGADFVNRRQGHDGRVRVVRLRHPSLFVPATLDIAPNSASAR